MYDLVTENFQKYFLFQEVFNYKVFVEALFISSVFRVIFL